MMASHRCLLHGSVVRFATLSLLLVGATGHFGAHSPNVGAPSSAAVTKAQAFPSGGVRGTVALLGRGALGRRANSAFPRARRQPALTPCSCKDCKAWRDITDRPTEGFKGMQCKPGPASEFKVCEQQGSPVDWVVQTAQEINYERFCFFTCKPVIPQNIQPEYGCTQLSATEVKLMGQSPSGNGRGYIYHSNPMTDSLTLDDVVPDRAVPNRVVADPVANMQRAFAAAHGGEHA